MKERCCGCDGVGKAVCVVCIVVYPVHRSNFSSKQEYEIRL